MNNIGYDEVKVLQLDILCAVDEFCRNNGINYSLADGTLLGAVRHKGFIPWDDDIDICLFRPDYEKLINEFPEAYKGIYKLVSLERDSKWDFPYAKVYDDRTICVENAYMGKIVGVNIDVFPFDEVPDDEDAFQQFNVWRRKKQFCLQFSRMKNLSSFKQKIKALLYRFFTMIRSRRKQAEILDRIAKSHNGCGYESVYECSLGVCAKKPFKKKTFDEFVEYPFEDKVFLGVKDADSYLSSTYGDYLQLPPIEKRVSHHSFESYWKGNEKV